MHIIDQIRELEDRYTSNLRHIDRISDHLEKQDPLERNAWAGVIDNLLKSNCEITRELDELEASFYAAVQ